MFSKLLSDRVLEKMGKIYVGKPLKTKSRKELIASMKERYWQYLRADNGDLPDGFVGQARTEADDLKVLAWAAGGQPQ
jgi:hypothetical protein